MLPAWNWDTVNFWSQIAFAFTGLELVSAMSEEVRDPRRTLPRAVFGAGALIALMYIVGNVCHSRAGACRRSRSSERRFSTPSQLDRLRCKRRLPRRARGDSGDRGQRRRRRQHGGRHCARAFCGGHRPLSARRLRQDSSRAGRPRGSRSSCRPSISAAILLGSQINETTRGAYQKLIDAGIILYFIPFLYMFAAVIKLAYRKDRNENPHAVLVPGGILASGSAAGWALPSSSAVSWFRWCLPAERRTRWGLK